MKKVEVVTVVLLLLCVVASGQTDTIITFLNRYNYKCEKKDAKYYAKTYQVNDKWHRQKFLLSNNHLEDEIDFLDKDFKKFDGFYREYKDSIGLFNEMYYKNDKLLYGTFYHKNGKKAGYAEFDTAKGEPIKQQGWDENGNEIPNYTFYKIAEFPGKSQGWIKFLQRNLNADIPTYRGAKAGKYTVILGFFVEPDGTLSDISILEDPGYGTGAEALRVMRLSVGWTPGIENNKVKRFLYRQPITFQVSDY